MSDNQHDSTGKSNSEFERTHGAVPTDLERKSGQAYINELPVESTYPSACIDLDQTDEVDSKIRPKDHRLEDRTGQRRSHRRSDSKSRDKKRSSKKRHKYYDDNQRDRDDSGSSSDSDDCSSYSDDSDERRRKRHHKERKRKHEGKKRKKDADRVKDKKSKKKRHKTERSSDERSDNLKSDAPTFGKYGIIKASDMPKMQRSFETWLSEVHGIHVSTSNIPRYEIQQYFDTYREDYNTATLPHVKYYNFDKWELEEHEKQRSEMEQSGRNNSAIINDERNHAIELQRIAKRKEEAALQFVAATMNTTKVKEMQHQKQLQTQMQMAFKMGDHETYRKIKEKLQPEEK